MAIRCCAAIGLAPVNDVRTYAYTNRPWLAADPTLGPWQQLADLNAIVADCAYFIELRRAEGDKQYLYVSMAAFTTDLKKIGVPTIASGATFQTNVANMNVYSNVSGIVTGTGIAGGNIEFWPNNYSAHNAKNVPNADSSKFDFGAQMSSPQDGHGCMQVHNHDARQTLFAINKWRAGSKAEIGIGNNPNPSGNPDWTEIIVVKFHPPTTSFAQPGMPLPNMFPRPRGRA